MIALSAISFAKAYVVFGKNGSGKKTGYDVIEATNYSDALKYAKAQFPNAHSISANYFKNYALIYWSPKKNSYYMRHLDTKKGVEEEAEYQRKRGKTRIAYYSADL